MQAAEIVKLKYLSAPSNGLKYVASRGGGDQTKLTGDFAFYDTSMKNARHPNYLAEFERDGFCLVNAKSNVIDFYDDDQVRSVHSLELESLVTNISGCKTFEIIDFTRRSSATKVQSAHSSREPAVVVHNDYSEWGGIARLKQHLEETSRESEFDDILRRGFAIINVWRSISDKPIEVNPLGMCRAGSVQSEDLHKAERNAGHRTGELYYATYSAHHDWSYFPLMTKDEPLVFKTYDSRQDGRARFVLHSSFESPKSAPDAPARESLETRCLVTF